MTGTRDQVQPPMGGLALFVSGILVAFIGSGIALSSANEGRPNETPWGFLLLFFGVVATARGVVLLRRHRKVAAPVAPPAPQTPERRLAQLKENATFRWATHWHESIREIALIPGPRTAHVLLEIYDSVSSDRKPEAVTALCKIADPSSCREIANRLAQIVRNDRGGAGAKAVLASAATCLSISSPFTEGVVAALVDNIATWHPNNQETRDLLHFLDQVMPSWRATYDASLQSAWAAKEVKDNEEGQALLKKRAQEGQVMLEELLPIVRDESQRHLASPDQLVAVLREFLTNKALAMSHHFQTGRDDFAWPLHLRTREHRERTAELIGEELYRRGGEGLMKSTLDEHLDADRNIDMWWSGIGDWQG